MSHRNKLSVIMSIYQESPEEILATVQNLLKQTEPPEEIVIVLDDPNNLAARKTLETLTRKYPQIITIFNDQNIGLGASLNKAVSIATGDLVMRQDIGDTSDMVRLAKQKEYLKNHPETDLLFTGWTEVYEDGSERVIIPKKIWFEHIKKYFFTKSLLLHASLMARKEILIKHPYPRIGRPEDLILFLELIREGYRFSVLEESLYTYQVDRRLRYQKIKNYSRNYLPYLIKNIPYYWSSPWFWLYFFRIVGEYLVSRNEYVFNHIHHLAARIWKVFSR